MRLIDADKLKEKLKAHHDFFVNAWGGFSNLPVKDKARVDEITNCIAEVVNAPTIDPESLRPQGHWIGEADGYADGKLVYDVWYCSECNHCIDDGTDDPDLLPDFCPGCGAYMKGAGKNADS